MKKFHLFSILLAAAFIFVSANLFAQSVGIIKAVMGDLPSSMSTGETYKVAVNVTNTGTNEWSSEHIHSKADGKFEITKEWSGDWKLQPGETMQIYYKITAPGTPGKYRLKVTIFYDNKKVISRSKKITVVDTDSPGNK